MKMSEREMHLSVIAFAALLIGSSWYYLTGKAPDWKAKRVEIERLAGQIRLDTRRIAMQESWMAELNSLQERLHVFDINQKSVSPQLMQTIKNLSTEHGLRILRSQPYTEKPTGDLFEIGINCTWEGELKAIVDFLTELQQQGGNYDVRTLNISPSGKNTGALKGNMVIHCAYIKRAMDKTTPDP